VYVPRESDIQIGNPWVITERSHPYCNSFRWRQKMKRRDFFRTAGTAGIGSATLVSFPALADALAGPAQAPSSRKKGEQPANPFVILLHGLYRPVVRCPDLGLSQANVCDGSYFRTKIYPVSGLPGEDEDKEHPIGNFYVALGMGGAVAYDLPGGALAMVFTFNGLTPVPDGEGGRFLVGQIDLNIIEATGIYQSFVNGHNKMVDILHRLADGSFVEHCYCIISRP